eukprot:UN26941
MSGGSDAYSTMISENRTVYFYKSVSEADIVSTYSDFCENRGLSWYEPLSASDGIAVITYAYNLDAHHTWMITKNEIDLGAGTWGGYDVRSAVDSWSCGTPNGCNQGSDFSGIRKWSSSLCDPDYRGRTECWDTAHVYDWLVCMDFQSDAYDSLLSGDRLVYFYQSDSATNLDAYNNFL